MIAKKVNKYGISKVLPQLSTEKVEAVLSRIKEKGFPHQIDLEKLNVDDLIEGDLLTTNEATILIQYWNEGKFFDIFLTRITIIISCIAINIGLLHEHYMRQTVQDLKQTIF